MRARDPQSGHLLALEQSGEIEILSPAHMSGYLDNPEETLQAFTADGYFRTGDLGYCLSDHQFVFQARLGDSLRLGGFLVNPAEIEHVIEDLRGIEACQVVSVESNKGNVAVAFVVCNPKNTAFKEQWSAECKRRLAPFKVPVHFEIISAFPTIESANSTKIQKHKLREMAQNIIQKTRHGQTTI